MIPVEIMYEQLYLKFGYDDHMYYQFKEFIDNLPKAEAIPVNYILDFMKERDPVYKNNISTMLKCYNKEVDDRDKIPTYDIE